MTEPGLGGGPHRPTVTNSDPATDPRFTDLVNRLAGGYMTIGQMVLTVLREALNNGTFAPGEWLRQESLAAAIGVSRIPVRTALLQLESEGLVTFHPHRGARVRSLTPEQIDEIYRLRALLECFALRQSMSAMTPERLNVLSRLAAKLDQKRQGEDFLAARVDFYRELYDADNNPMLVGLIDDLRSLVGRFLLSIRVVGADHGDHSALVEHIRAEDGSSAEQWLTAHLEGVREGIRALVDGDSLGDSSAAEVAEPAGSRTPTLKRSPSGPPATTPNSRQTGRRRQPARATQAHNRPPGPTTS